MSLSRSREHDFPSDERPVECRRCGFVLRPGMEKRDLCSGMNQRHKLSRTGSLDRSTPLSPVSDSNSGREHQKDEAFREYVRSLPCLVCGDMPPSDACHYRSWGAGHSDEANLFPACRRCHQDQHTMGIESWQEHHSTDLEYETDRIWSEYQQQDQDSDNFSYYPINKV